MWADVLFTDVFAGAGEPLMMHLADGRGAGRSVPECGMPLWRCIRAERSTPLTWEAR